MKTHEALVTILKTPLEAKLPNGLENDVSTNVPLAITVSTRAMLEALEKLGKRLEIVADKLENLRR